MPRARDSDDDNGSAPLGSDAEGMDEDVNWEGGEDADFDEDGGDDGEDGDDVDPSRYEPVRYERSGTDVLPWRKSAVDMASANLGEDGFVDLEEIPAGTYEIVKLPNGGTVIKLKKDAAPAPAAAAPAAAAATAAAGGEVKLTKKERKAAAKAARAAAAAEAASAAAGAPVESAEPPAAAAKKPKKEAAVPAAEPAAAAAPAAATKPESKKRKRDEGAAAAAPAPAPAQPQPRKGATAPHARVAPSQRAALAVEDVAPEWGTFSLHPSLLAAVARLGFAAPTPIQRAALPPALSHYRDVVGAAETGSGKTLAYGLPILHRLLERRERLGMDAPAAASSSSSDAPPPRRTAAFRYLPALVLAPTRELAMQVADHLSAVAAGTPLRVAAIVGGLSAHKQGRLLRARPDVIVATPGRFWDLASSAGSGGWGDFLSGLHALQFLVLDEADRLCEKGHYDSLTSILAAVQAPPPPAEGESEVADAAGVLDPVAEKILRAKAGEALPAAAAKAAAAEEEDDEDDEEEEEGGDDEDEDAADEPAAAASASAAAPKPGGLAVTDAPRHYRRQSFLFSATLGLTTAQSARDAASALLAAKASAHAAAAAAANTGAGGANVPSKLSKKAMRKALAAARKLTPVEALMARVGVQGKPAVIKIERAGAGGASSSAAAADREDGEDDHGEEDADADGAAEASDIGAAIPASVALPPGLRLARLTCGPGGNKDVRLYHFLLRFPGRALVFVNSIAALKRVGALLGALGLPVHVLHARMQQRQRLKSLDRFRTDARGGVLVATDVAARGLDVPSVAHVLHYSLPASAEVFVHRCGRTARAATAGLAAALVGPEDQRQYGRILGVLGLGSVGLPEFPLDDERYARRLAARVALARRITTAQAASNAAASAKHSLLSLAREAGLDVDDATAAEGGLTADDLAAGGGGGDGDEDEEEAGARKKAAGGSRSAKRARRAASGWDADDLGSDDDGGGGDDDAGERRAQAAVDGKRRARELAALRAELAAELAAPLAPSGMSRRYVATVNPQLLAGGGGSGSSRAVAAAATAALSHPLHGRVAVVGSAMEEDGEDGAPLPAAAPASRSGSALVAPRVALSADALVGGSSAAAAVTAVGGLIPLRPALPAAGSAKARLAAAAGGSSEALGLLAARGRKTALSVPAVARAAAAVAAAKAAASRKKDKAGGKSWAGSGGGGSGKGKAHHRHGGGSRRR